MESTVLTTDEIIAKSKKYKSFVYNGFTTQINFYKVSDEYKEPLYDFIKTTLQYNGTVNFLCAIFNKVGLSMFKNNNFIVKNTVKCAVIIVYGEEEEE